VCSRADVIPTGCAVARAFPIFSRKTSGNNSSNNSDKVGSKKNEVEVNIEFLITDGKPVTEKELTTLEDMAHGIRLAAR